jgi:outer membrane biosynthesis protein TonB
MAEIEDIEKLKKLSPEERIAKLKQLEQKRKKEIKEAEKLIELSVKEIKEDQKLQEEIEEEERLQREKSKRDVEEGLEEVIEKNKQELMDDQLNTDKQYQIKLSMEPMADLYERLRGVYQDVVSNGEMTTEQQRQLADINYAMQYKSDAMNTGEYRAESKQIEDIISASKSILNYIRKGV